MENLDCSHSWSLSSFPPAGRVQSFLDREVSEEKSKHFSGITPAAQEWGATSASLGLRLRDG